MQNASGYTHVQKGILQPILLVCAASCAIAAGIARNTPPLMPVCLATAIVCVILSFALATLTVSDGGDRLIVRFGPIPFFKKAIPYAEIAAAAKERTTVLAGWGIHWTRKGWLWNIGGFECARIFRKCGASALIGSDDAAGLTAFLQSKIESASK